MQGAARCQWSFHWQAVQRRRRRAQTQPGGPLACGRIAALRPACGEWLHGAARALHCIPQANGAGHETY
ncbi:MAG: hypothetical protein HY936_06105 [Nitrosomonadales bacterium]|nr:hypothetical protein [Nitrosomonadales bacterium]